MDLLVEDLVDLLREVTKEEEEELVRHLRCQMEEGQVGEDSGGGGGGGFDPSSWLSDGGGPRGGGGLNDDEEMNSLTSLSLGRFSKGGGSDGAIDEDEGSDGGERPGRGRIRWWRTTSGW